MSAFTLAVHQGRTGWTGRLEGGKIWTAESSRQIFYIWKVIDGKHHESSTRCHDRNPALKAYLEFMGDPEKRGGATMALDDRLIQAYLDDCRSRGLSEGRTGRTRSYLAWWGARLPDLRRAELRQLDEASQKAPNRGMRINILETFWSWLAQTGRMERNPAEHLRVPPPRGAQVER